MPPRVPIEEARQAMERMCNWHNMSVAEHLQIIRNSLQPLIVPFVELVNDIESCLTVRGHYRNFDMGNGFSTYRILPLMDDGSIRAEQARSAMDALDEIQVVEHNIGKDENFIFKGALRLGMQLERISIRPFEPLVAAEKSRRKSASETRKKTTKINDDQWLLVRKYIQQRIKAGDTAAKACDRVASQLRTGTFKALPSVRIETAAKTIQNRWSVRNQQ